MPATGAVAFALGTLLLSSAAHADLLFTASGTSAQPNPISASASFNLSGTTLTIVLTNTSTSNTSYHNPDVLTGLFFNVTGNLTLTPVSALLTAGSLIVNAAQCNPGPCNGTNVGGEFAYIFSSIGFANNATLATRDYGISSAGDSNLSPSFGAPNFNGPNLDGPGAVDGLQFGIVGSDYSNATAASNLADTVPLIQKSVTLEFTVPINFLLSDISDVAFSYGTGPDSVLTSNRTSVPEPGTVSLLGAGLLGLVLLFRRRLPRLTPIT